MAHNEPDMTEPPVFSALIQSYNDHPLQPAGFSRALHSLPVGVGMEILVNDDSETQQTPWASALHAPPDTLVRGDNLHEARAYNMLARQSQGEFLVLLQGDYCLPVSPAWLMDSLVLMLEQPELGMVSGYSGFNALPKDDATIFDLGFGPPGYRAIESAIRMRDVPIEAWRSFNGTLAPPWSRGSTKTLPFAYAAVATMGPLVVRRRAFFEAGGIDESFSKRGEPAIGYDNALSLQLWRNGWRVGVAEVAHLNGVGGRQSLRKGHAHLRYRNSRANYQKLRQSWARGGASIQAKVATLNRALIPQPGRIHPADEHTERACAWHNASGSDFMRYLPILRGVSGRIHCRNFVNLTASDLPPDGDHRVCSDGWGAGPRPCTVLSVTERSSWAFEGALAEQMGCTVHVFHSGNAHRPDRKISGVHFHSVRMATAASGSESGAPTMQLPRMFDHVAGDHGSTHAHVGLLKIDCAGCEFHMFRHLVERAPRLLQRVRLLHIKLHVGGRGSMQLDEPDSLKSLLSHVMDDHGFRVVSHSVIQGDPVDRNLVDPRLVAKLVPQGPCCYQLQLMRLQSAGLQYT